MKNSKVLAGLQKTYPGTFTNDIIEELKPILRGTNQRNWWDRMRKIAYILETDIVTRFINGWTEEIAFFLCEGIHPATILAYNFKTNKYFLATIDELDAMA